MSVETHRAELVDQSLPMPRRFRALFTLRSIGGDDAIAALLGSLEDPSALFRHEVAFALGQMQAPGAVETLKRVLRDTGDDEMVRHECAEALGAIATEECLDALREACEDGTQVVRETAKLALQRLEHAREKRGEAPAADATAGKTLGSAKEKLSARSNTDGGAAANNDSLDADSPYISVDPVPAAPASVATDILTATLLDESADMWDRYGAMFALRNRGPGPEVAATLGKVLGSSASALLKHEVCYVLGQLQEADARARASLVKTLEDRFGAPDGAARGGGGHRVHRRGGHGGSVEKVPRRRGQDSGRVVRGGAGHNGERTGRRVRAPRPGDRRVTLS